MLLKRLKNIYWGKIKPEPETTVRTFDLKMKTREEILKELKAFAPKLASLEKVNVSSVPENYFVNFKSTIIEKAKLSGVTEELSAITPELAKIEKRNTVKVPVGYFTSLPNDLLQQIRKEEVAVELKQIAPVLSQVEKENAFEVSANYFKGFPQQMMKTIVAKEKSKAKETSPAWLSGLNHTLENLAQLVFKPKYSFAFAGTAATVIIAVMMFAKVEQCNDLDCKMASLTDEEINTYLDGNADTYTDEIFEATDETTATSTKATEFENEMLKDVSDVDLNNAILD